MDGWIGTENILRDCLAQSKKILLEKLTCYADDKFALEWNRDKKLLAIAMQTKLQRVITWLKQSGLKVNEAKTELCLFHKRDTTPIEILLNGSIVKSKQNMNVLGAASWLRW